MLTDTERKVLRILSNYFGMRRCMPDMHDLCRMAGRSPERVSEALETLNSEGYIIGIDPPNIKIIVAWERQYLRFR